MTIKIIRIMTKLTDGSKTFAVKITDTEHNSRMELDMVTERDADNFMLHFQALVLQHTNEETIVDIEPEDDALIFLLNVSY